jgi:hypothetical protein
VRRINMLKAAAEAYFRTRKRKRAQFETQFSNLLKESLHYSNRRNEIAHGRVSLIYTRKRGKPNKQLGYYLLPSFFNPKKFNLEQIVTHEYVSSDLIHYRQEFTKLRFRLDHFRDHLFNQKNAAVPSPSPNTPPWQ